MSQNKHDQYCLTFSILYIGLQVALMVVHGLLGVIQGNIFWLVVNIIFTMIAITFVALTAILLFRRCIYVRENDLLSFILSIIAFIIAIICLVWWLGDAINNLIGVVKEL